MTDPKILLVIGGGIAAYKACELVRTIRKAGGEVTCVLTEGGAKFVTPMALAALSENPVHTTLWDLKNEVEMGHIQLSREADLVVVCPATANMLAKMAAGIADDLATTLLLATDKPVMAVPAMNVRMWQHASTMRNVETLREAGVDVMEPDEGDMACGEFGPGRLPEPPAVWNRIAWALDLPESALIGQTPVPELPQPEAAFDQPEEQAEDQPEERADDGANQESAHEAELGGLSASLISRSIQKAKQAIGLSGSSDAADESVTQELLPPDEDVPDLAPDELPVGGPLLSSKGSARAAPPTDPEAINHVVSADPEALPPEPLDGDEQPVSVGEGSADGASAAQGDGADPLEGQPAFETDPEHRPLYGKHVLVTAGPTWEPIDPVRYIANRSSGRQGFAIAAAAAAAGARVTLVAGPVWLDTPPGVERVNVESAEQMADAVKTALPADIAVMVAAVADWRTKHVETQKMKKRGSAPPALLLTENPDILATVAGSAQRPPLLIGFAAETQDVLKHARAKRQRKGADWIIANDVSGDVMGGADNTVHIVKGKDVESLPEMPKEDVARILVERFADALNK